jgi:hypothetical protein
LTKNKADRALPGLPVMSERLSNRSEGGHIVGLGFCHGSAIAIAVVVGPQVDVTFSASDFFDLFNFEFFQHNILL